MDNYRVTMYPITEGKNRAIKSFYSESNTEAQQIFYQIVQVYFADQDPHQGHSLSLSYINNDGHEYEKQFAYIAAGAIKISDWK